MRAASAQWSRRCQGGWRDSVHWCARLARPLAGIGLLAWLGVRPERLAMYLSHAWFLLVVLNLLGPSHFSAGSAAHLIALLAFQAIVVGVAQAPLFAG